MPVADAVLLELLTNPFACVAIAPDAITPIGLQQRRVFLNDRTGIEWRLCTSDHIQDQAFPVAMADSQRKAIVAPSRLIRQHG